MAGTVIQELVTRDLESEYGVFFTPDKQYADWIREYTSEILLVGISYDKKRDMPVSLRSISYDL